MPNYPALTRALQYALDNDITLPDELLARLDAATDFKIGFPSDFIEETASWVYGDTAPLVDGRAERGR